MKIVYIYPVFIQLAGTERVFTDKMNYLADVVGYDVTLLTYEQGLHSFPFPLSPKVKHVDLDIRFFPLYRYCRIVRWYKERKLNKVLSRRFNALMEEMKPDIVIAPTYYIKVLRLVSKCPCKFVRILESHIDKRHVYINSERSRRGWLAYMRSYYEDRVVGWTARRFDLLVALSPEDAKDWSRCLMTTVIPNVVHLQRDVHGNLDRKRVVFAGRLVEQKGISFLVQIWKIVNERHPDWLLDVYGEGILKYLLMSNSHNIQVNGPTPNLLDVFCDSSIFVLTSVYEPFGLVIPEAMSCGLPVVAFDCDYGPREIIKDGVDGFLVPVGDVKMFSDRVCQLIEDPELRKRMGNAGIQSSQRYSADVIMPQWINLFEELLCQIK